MLAEPRVQENKAAAQWAADVLPVGCSPYCPCLPPVPEAVLADAHRLGHHTAPHPRGFLPELHTGHGWAGELHSAQPPRTQAATANSMSLGGGPLAESPQKRMPWSEAPHDAPTQQSRDQVGRPPPRCRNEGNPLMGLQPAWGAQRREHRVGERWVPSRGLRYREPHRFRGAPSRKDAHRHFWKQVEV